MALFNIQFHWLQVNNFSIKLHYITLYYMDPKLVRMTAGCGTNHTNTITHTYTVQLKHSKSTYTHTYINQNTVNLHYVHKPLKG
jgi:type VI protein secretion system component Hcp